MSAALFPLPGGPLGALDRLASRGGPFVEVGERDRTGQPRYHNAWCTDLEVDADNVGQIIQSGRARWQIEHEQFNVHTNQGDALEHNYGHGKHT